MLIEVKAANGQLHRARDEVDSAIRRESVSLGLKPETTFTHSHVMLDPSRFPAVLLAQHGQADSALLRDTAKALIAHCTSTAATTLRSVETAISESKRMHRATEVIGCGAAAAVSHHRPLQNDAILAKGSARTALAAELNTQSKMLIRREVFGGPHEGRFQTVAEKLDRPLVRC